MTNDTSKRLTAKETRAIIDALETSIINHGKWLTTWHQNLLCNLPLNEDVVAKNAHKLSQFGKWYYNEKSQILKDHPDFTAIDAAYRELHETARNLSSKVQNRDTLQNRDYGLFLDSEVKLSGLLISLRDEFQEALFSFDALTHVLNRQAFLRILSQEHARSIRTKNHSCIAMVDLDNFKHINDSYGHQVGDKTLEEAAQFLVKNLRPYDTMCRYGGEEFLICLPQTKLEIAKRVLSRLQKALSNNKIKINKKENITVTASFGLATTEVNVSMMDTITRADSAMYAAKHGGGNRVIIWGDKV
jgi:diguanylate cyclase (GGDEF)-like protein